MPNNHKSIVHIYLYHTVISLHHVIPTTLTSFYSRHHVTLLCDLCNRHEVEQDDVDAAAAGVRVGGADGRGLVRGGEAEVSGGNGAVRFVAAQVSL